MEGDREVLIGFPSYDEETEEEDYEVMPLLPDVKTDVIELDDTTHLVVVLFADPPEEAEDEDEEEEEDEEDEAANDA